MKSLLNPTIFSINSRLSLAVSIRRENPVNLSKCNFSTIRKSNSVIITKRPQLYLCRFMGKKPYVRKPSLNQVKNWSEEDDVEKFEMQFVPLEEALKNPSDKVIKIVNSMLKLDFVDNAIFSNIIQVSYILLNCFHHPNCTNLSIKKYTGINDEEVNRVEMMYAIAAERLENQKNGIFDSTPSQAATKAVVEEAPAAAPEPVKEKVAFDLKLTVVDAKAKIKIIKEVRAITGLGLKEVNGIY